MSPKTISDAVEALIGAHFVGGGVTAAIEFMKWMNMDVAFEPDLAGAACQRAFVDPSDLKAANLHGLESLLGYEFQNKALLVEAMTHASRGDPGGCYQRIEFLGDSLLDFLLTRHFYSTYPGESPGGLSDLRSASVNNEKFARAAAKHGIHKYLRHGSSTLESQITNFVKVVEQSEEGSRFQYFGAAEAPKVLGDIIESIAAAILIDKKFDFEFVWGILEPILFSLPTPQTVELQPIRELQEICGKFHYNCEWNLTEQGEIIVATVVVDLEKEKIVGKGTKTNRKSAKMAAAQQILSLMQERGLYHSRRTDIDNVLLEEAPICPANEKTRCIVEHAANVTEGKDESFEELRGATNAETIFKGEQAADNSVFVQTNGSVMTLTEKVVSAATTPISFAHEKIGGVLENASKDEFMEEVLVTINEDAILQVEPVTASSARVQMEEAEMVFSEYQCRKRRRCEDNPVYDSIMKSGNEGDAYLPRHLESTYDMDNKITSKDFIVEENEGDAYLPRYLEYTYDMDNKITSREFILEENEGDAYLPRHLGSTYDMDNKIRSREFIVEESKSPNANGARYGKEEGSRLSNYSPAMKPRLLKTSAKSRTSEHVIVDKIDNVNQNYSRDDGLANNMLNNSGALANSASTCHGVEKNRIQSNQSSFSPALPPQVNQAPGGPRVALYEICSKRKWQKPVYKFEERGIAHNKSYVSTVRIPNVEFIEARGDAKHTKKNAQDSAASKLLYELQQGESHNCILLSNVN